MSRSSRSASGTEEVLELTRMTKKGIQALCQKNKLYQTPELNDVLYLHYQGYRDIECLEEYTGLKCLWLENNAISEISGLNHQRLLKCLFLNNNLIKRIENLQHCPELDTLNLSNNQISRIENCSADVLPMLTTLILSHNYLRTAEQLEEAVNCKMLSVLDLSHNRIEDILVVKVFGKMPELRVLDLDGNPVVNQIPQYRKTLIIECKNLTHLDRRPVFPRDRACAVAWKRGGYEEERREHLRWNKADRRRIRESVNATLRLRNRGGGDPQLELIPSSSDEDITERSSAPPREVPPAEQPADTMNTEGNVQQAESLPRPENAREIHKCQVCGRIECNYVHIKSRPLAPKIEVDPEEIMKDAQLLLDGKGESFLNTESEMQRFEMGDGIVNIPNISSIRYECEEGKDQSEENQTIPDNLDSMSLGEYHDKSNSHKDDLYKKAYVDYLDTADRLLYIESKVEAAKSIYAQSVEANTFNTTEYLLALANESEDNSSNQLSKLPSANHEIGSPVKSSSDTKQPLPVDTEGINLPEMIASTSGAGKEPINDITFNEQTTNTGSLQKKVLKIIDKNQTLPPSQKKKVRLLLIESDVPENHEKIPTTPIPTRKGRKIYWNRVQNNIKRSKIDKGGKREDMLDILADWTWNPFKNETATIEGALIDRNDSSLDMNTLSSTLNDSSIIVFPVSESGVVSPIPQKLTNVLSANDDEESEKVDLDRDSTDQIGVEEYLAEHSDEDDLLIDDSINRQSAVENQAASIREFVTSYDAFLHSIEGKVQDISIRCQTSCVPPEYLAEEANKFEATVSEVKSGPINIMSSAGIDTQGTEKVSSHQEDPVGSVDLIQPQADASLINDTEGNSKTVDSDTSECILNQESIGDQPDPHPDCLNITSNISFENMPKILGSSDHLQGFYTDHGRRNSEIIQRLLENPLTKKVSAVDICKDLRQTTDEMLQCLKNEKERNLQSTREAVCTVHDQKDQYEGTLYIIDNMNMHCGETSIEQTYSKILEKAKARVSAKRSRSLQAGHKKKSEVKKIERSKSNKHLIEDNCEPDLTESADSVDSESSQIENGKDPTDLDEKFQDSCDVGDYVADIVDEICDLNTVNENSSKVTQKSEQIEQNSSDINPLVEGTLIDNQSTETSRNLDSGDFLLEALSSYVISDGSDGPDIFEQAHCDLDSFDEKLLDIIAENPTPRYEFPEHDIEKISRISTSSCDVLLNTTYDTTLSSSCWDSKDMNQELNDIPSNGSSKEMYFKERHSGGIEHFKDPGEEILVFKGVERQSRDNSDSEKEDSESHPVSYESGLKEGRYTM